MPDSFYVHPRALCESPAVGERTRIWAFAHIMDNVHIGCDCNIGDHAFVESGAYIGNRVTVKNQVLIWEGIHLEDDVFVGPGVIFTNDCYPRSPRLQGVPEVEARYRNSDNWLEPIRVCQGASIGAGAIIAAGITIGSYATIAMGAIVTKNVAKQQLVMGNPARAKGWVCLCGHPLANDNDVWICPQCQERFYF